MKKIISIVSLLLTCFCVEMQATDGVYFKDIRIQQGTTTATLCVNVSAETVKLGNFQIEYTLPTGVTTVATEFAEFGPSCLAYNPHYTATTAFNIFSNSTNVGEDKTAVEIELAIPADIALGDHDIVLNSWQIAFADGTGKYVSDGHQTATLTVQKAAVIEELGDGNSVSIVPAAMKPGFYADGNVTALDIYYTSNTDLAGLSFNLNLPHAEFYSSAFDEDGNPVESVLNNDVYNNSAKTLSVETVDDQNLKITYSGVKTTRAANQRYIKAADVPTKLATIYIESEESLPADIYTLTLSDITLEEYVTAGTGTLHTGKNYSTIVVGTPEQNEAIIYGYCTSSAASAISTALKNVAIADVTAATVDEGAKFTDVLVNEKGGNSYYTRTSANYGTTVLPLDLTTENVDKLYMIVSMDANSIVLTEVENVSANTPCIFKGTINVEGATPTLGVPSEQGLGQTTFKGTYEATEIADGAGYYISSDGKFYGDGATVRPFRAYFEGNVNGVKSFSVKVDTPNGLIDITDQLSDEAIYSLQGIRMNNAQKGINIKGGKKVYVK